ncbi:hypothetical protein M758_9G154000 [Ceratodon purpureus]|nr:hypothetical protein M758_9G154000 [Ceratodon purpureus]
MHKFCGWLCWRSCCWIECGLLHLGMRARGHPADLFFWHLELCSSEVCHVSVAGWVFLMCGIEKEWSGCGGGGVFGSL